MTLGVTTCEPWRTVRDASKLMTKGKVGSLVVMERGRLTGILTEGDVSRAIAGGLDPDKATVKKVMSKSLITVSPRSRVEEAARLMAGKKVKKLPVVEDGSVVGMVTQTDIVAASYDLVTSLKEMVRARYRPPDFKP